MIWLWSSLHSAILNQFNILISLINILHLLDDLILRVFNISLIIRNQNWTTKKLNWFLVGYWRNWFIILWKVLEGIDVVLISWLERMFDHLFSSKLDDVNVAFVVGYFLYDFLIERLDVIFVFDIYVLHISVKNPLAWELVILMLKIWSRIHPHWLNSRPALVLFRLLKSPKLWFLRQSSSPCLMHVHKVFRRSKWLAI